MDENVSVEKLLKVIRMISQIMLESGAEAYRIEGTCDFICRSYGISEVDSIATPTGIYITISPPNKGNRTVISRIKNRSIDLSKLNDVNSISRLITSKQITLDEAINRLNDLKNNINIEKRPFYFIYEGIAAAFFTLLFRGGFIEFILALLTGIIVQYNTSKLKNLDSHQFFIGFFGAAIISSIAILTTHFLKMGDYNKVIVGGIMPLLPGLSMTNAIRDTMRGDLVSGVVRAAEAILVATSLAAGAGVIISIAYSLGLLIWKEVNFMIIDLICSFIATWFFALVMNAPKKSLFFSSLIASMGYFVYSVCLNLNQQLIGFFLGTLIISLLGELCARKIKMPATIFIFPAVVPIVPGLGLYQMMLEFVQNDIYEALLIGVKTLLNIGAMAIAIALVSLILTKAPNKIYGSFKIKSDK